MTPIPEDCAYYLEFFDTTGLEQNSFCTFRLGRYWSRRLKENDGVFLAHRNMIIDYLTVVSVETGKAMEVLKKHAKHSHMEFLFKNAKRTAPQRRFESMQKVYGPHRLNEDSIITVIYLRRNKEK
jgi:hypothetical protein